MEPLSQSLSHCSRSNNEIRLPFPVNIQAKTDSIDDNKAKIVIGKDVYFRIVVASINDSDSKENREFNIEKMSYCAGGSANCRPRSEDGYISVTWGTESNIKIGNKDFKLYVPHGTKDINLEVSQAGEVITTTKVFPPDSFRLGEFSDRENIHIISDVHNIGDNFVFRYTLDLNARIRSGRPQIKVARLHRYRHPLNIHKYFECN